MRERLPAPSISAMRFLLSSASFLLAFAVMRTPPASAQNNRRAQQKAEVIPIAVIVDVIYSHGRIEERYHESDGRDNALPKSLPETGKRDAFPWLIGELVGPGGATGEQSQYDCSQGE
jgi:hypothetical protein